MILLLFNILIFNISYLPLSTAKASSSSKKIMEGATALALRNI